MNIRLQTLLCNILSKLLGTYARQLSVCDRLILLISAASLEALAHGLISFLFQENWFGLSYVVLHDSIIFNNHNPPTEGQKSCIKESSLKIIQSSFKRLHFDKHPLQATVDLLVQPIDSTYFFKNFLLDLLSCRLDCSFSSRSCQIRSVDILLRCWQRSFSQLIANISSFLVTLSLLNTLKSDILKLCSKVLSAINFFCFFSLSRRNIVSFYFACFFLILMCGITPRSGSVIFLIVRRRIVVSIVKIFLICVG